MAGPMQSCLRQMADNEGKQLLTVGEELSECFKLLGESLQKLQVVHSEYALRRQRIHEVKALLQPGLIRPACGAQASPDKVSLRQDSSFSFGEGEPMSPNADRCLGVPEASATNARTFSFCEAEPLSPIEDLEVTRECVFVEPSRASAEMHGSVTDYLCRQAHVTTAVMDKSKRRHLVLNMDVNKTVVMSDKVSGKTPWHVVNEALANVSWGVEAEGTWTAIDNLPQSMRPDPKSEGQEVMSYTEFNEKLHPGSKNKKKRQSLNSSFTDEGQPGECMQSLAKKALAELTNPDGSMVGIIPSFFEMMQELKREKRSFTLFFRTFGEDLGDIAVELNNFCEGRHPLFPGVRMDGSDGEADYRFSMSSMSSCGTFHRDDDCTSLIMGTTEQPGEGRFKDATDNSLRFYEQFPDIQVISGLFEVSNFLRQRYNECCTIGIRDYFHYWKSKDQTQDGGKPFFFDSSASTNRHEIFFDDNIKLSGFKIVQPIRFDSFSDVHWVRPMLETHVVRAEPWESIYDRHYFINHLARLEAGYDRKLQVRGRLKALLLSVLKRHRLLDLFRSEMGTSRSHEDYDAWQGLRVYDEMVSIRKEIDEEETHSF